MRAKNPVIAILFGIGFVIFAIVHIINQEMGPIMGMMGAPITPDNHPVAFWLLAVAEILLGLFTLFIGYNSLEKRKP